MGNRSTISPRTPNSPGASTISTRTYPASDNRSTSSRRGYVWPTHRENRNRRNSPTGIIPCIQAWGVVTNTGAGEGAAMGFPPSGEDAPLSPGSATAPGLAPLASSKAANAEKRWAITSLFGENPSKGTVSQCGKKKTGRVLPKNAMSSARFSPARRESQTTTMGASIRRARAAINQAFPPDFNPLRARGSRRLIRPSKSWKKAESPGSGRVVGSCIYL